MLVEFYKAMPGIDIYRVTHGYGTNLVYHRLADDALNAKRCFGNSKANLTDYEQAVRSYLDRQRIQYPDRLKSLSELGLL